MQSQPSLLAEHRNTILIWRSNSAGIDCAPGEQTQVLGILQQTGNRGETLAASGQLPRGAPVPGRPESWPAAAGVLANVRDTPWWPSAGQASLAYGVFPVKKLVLNLAQIWNLGVVFGGQRNIWCANSAGFVV